MSANADYGWRCPNGDDRQRHDVKWNSGNPRCLTCDVPAVWRAQIDGSGVDPQ